MEYPECTVILQEASSLQVQPFVTSPIRKGCFGVSPKEVVTGFTTGFCRASLRAKNQ